MDTEALGCYPGARSGGEIRPPRQSYLHQE